MLDECLLNDPNKVGHKFTLNGTVMQDSNTSRMTHNVYELIEYATTAPSAAVN